MADGTAVVGIGVIGAGRIGIVHASALATRLSARVELRGIADPNLDAAKRLASELGVERAEAAPAALLADDSIEAVVVCSSTDTHARLVTDAAAAGKHVFCEKPLDLDLERIDRVLAAVKESGVKLQLGFNRRFDPDFARIRERVAAGEIGAPELLRITSRDPEPPPLSYVKVSGGLFLDMTIHDFDMARFLLGREVEEVYTAAGVLVDPAIGEAGDVDTAMITLRFEGGAIATIDNSRRAVYGYDQRVEVFGARGMIANTNRTAEQTVLSDGGGVHAALPLHFFMERYTESYAAELEAFVDCVVGDEDPPVDGEDGRQAVVLGYAAKRSLDENRPVKTSEIG